MWYCSSCGYENKDEYRFCLGCGTPRPQPEPEPPKPAVKQAPKKVSLTQEERKGGIALLVLLLFALLLIAAVVAVLLKFPLFGAQKPEQAPAGAVNARHISDIASTESPEGGGTSSYVFGTDELVPTTPAPEATPEPSPTPLPTPEPTHEPTPTVDPDYLIPGSDSRYITEAELDNLSREQIMLARNEIYARHGWIFSTPELASYFNAKSWYRGTVDPRYFSESVFNEYESANINLIRQYEIAHWGG